MEKEKIKRTFEVMYYDLNKNQVTVPVSAHEFTFRSNHLVFIMDDEDVVAFKDWVFVRRLDKNSTPVARHYFPPSQFTDEQLEMIQRKLPSFKETRLS